MNARAVTSLKEFIEKRIKYEKILLKWITENMTNDVDNPQYIKFLKPHQYKLFKDFLELFRISILADGIFVNDLFNLGTLFSKYTNSDRLILKDKDFNGIQGS